MRKVIVFTFLVAICGGVIAGTEESLIKNGDFEKGSSGWKGDEEIVSHSGNNICLIELDESENVEFFQHVKSRGYKELLITFRVKKSKDYEGRGFEVRMSRDVGGFYYSTRNAPSSADTWQDHTVRMTHVDGSSRVKISFIVLSGETGYLAFDEIKVVGK